MKGLNNSLARAWTQVGARFLPFAEAGSAELPMRQLLRLSLFQLTVGMSVVLLIGTLNRVMIVELGVAAWLVALMVALPLLFAPLRVLIGHRSDTHRSALGWKRVPYIWMGTLLQFGGLAIMPFALLVLSGEGHGPAWTGQMGAALAFLLVGAGVHTAQTAGLALATDLAPRDKRPQVVALLYVMLLVGMALSAIVFGVLLIDFSPMRLIQVIQGAAVVTMVGNGIALWKQEARNPDRTRRDAPRPPLRASWRAYIEQPQTRRFLIAVGLGTAGFNMQDILLEPYGAEVLGLSVSATTALMAMLAGGALCAFVIAARLLLRGFNAYRLAAMGALIGIFAFSAVIFSGALSSVALFRSGTFAIGFGGGFFAVGTLIAAMSRDAGGHTGVALGAWGAVQAFAAGGGIFLGGAIRDLVNMLGERGALGVAMTGPEVGYSVVYHIEIALLFATLVAIGPLVRTVRDRRHESSSGRLDLAGNPG